MSDKVESSSGQNLARVFVWALPRTLGTAFAKCMSYADGMQIVYEPFVGAYHFGPEAIIKPNENMASFASNANAYEVELEHAIDDNICTFEWVKNELEADYPGKKVLLVKDQTFCLNNRYDLIPSGFRHAFLIRHPYRVLPSWKSMLVKLFRLDYDKTSWSEVVGFGLFENPYLNQCKLLKYVKENVDPNVVVFDADDLQSDPGSILSQFCQAVDIHYTDDLLEWPEERDIVKSWKSSRTLLQGNLLESEGGFYDGALMSTGFKPPKALPRHEELSADLQTVADESMPYYDEMRKMCISVR